MKMLTQSEMDKYRKTIESMTRRQIASKLREKAEAHPKWEVHDLLKQLASEIEPPSEGV